MPTNKLPVSIGGQQGSEKGVTCLGAHHISSASVQKGHVGDDDRWQGFGRTCSNSIEDASAEE